MSELKIYLLYNFLHLTKKVTDLAIYKKFIKSLNGVHCSIVCRNYVPLKIIQLVRKMLLKASLCSMLPTHSVQLNVVSPFSWLERPSQENQFYLLPSPTTNYLPKNA